MANPRQAPSRGDRHGGGKGTPVGSGSGRDLRAIEPPPLLPGQARCPMCRNRVTMTKGGRLRSHVDLFGSVCSNHSISLEPAELEAIPEVQFSARDRPISGRCQECDRQIPPERRLCGRCSANRYTPATSTTREDNQR